MVSALVYAQPGTRIDAASGRATMVLVALPAELAPVQRDAYCEELLLATGPVRAETVVFRGEIATGTVEGCEVSGTEEVASAGETHELATYGALVFLGDDAFMVTGFVDAAARDEWVSQFGAAARSVHRVQR